ncbi:hypothetical protein [Vibrio sp. LaRot3]|uniref:hypothetical protein n=1 Tax=Vibrio sp. LaRot3 TaxID=2998829 RepID=UPI0022CDEE18|nr:hypothetical protein [Vibrio sp. LaRot3]MDA0147377.1 hypothetical protein [Vibrio sp. LaRot3]
MNNNTLPKTQRTPLNVAIAWIALLCIPLAMYGFFIEFVPTETVNKVAKTLSVILTIVILIFFRKGVASKMMSKRKVFQAIEFGFRVLMIAYTLHICFAYSVPGLQARLLGKQHANVQIVVPRENHATRECEFVIENDYLEPTLHGYVCISETSYLTKDQVYILSGYQSSLGFYVKHAVPNSAFKKILQEIKKERGTVQS